MTRPRRVGQVLAVLAVAVATPAQAEDFFFQTPSKNISCAYDDDDGTPYVRCDIREFTPSIRAKPGDCDLDWGDSFSITPRDRLGQVVCHGDTVMSPDAATLGYGQNFEMGGITCRSETSGLTCRNARGHGFFLSKAKQETF